jgi:antitoxin component YwqK of YwqJK toxin-antitoxin module
MKRIRNTIIAISIIIVAISCTKVKTEYWENGVTMSEITMKHDKKNGKAMYWYKNGNKQMEAFYKNDELDGTLKRWHPNSVVESIANFKDGKLNGKKEIWDKDGNKLSEETYTNDTLNGSYKTWYDNGVTKIDGSYKNGKYDGKWKSWDVKGFLVGEGEFKDGTGIQKNFNIKGDLILTVEIKNNQKDGKESWYNEKGELAVIRYYEKDKLVKTEELIKQEKAKK